MASNPYESTEYESSWQQGFVAGFLQPDEEHPAPTPLTWEQQVVYDEGVLAGRDLSQTLRIPPSSRWASRRAGGTSSTIPSMSER
jgi:hypothetical protein